MNLNDMPITMDDNTPPQQPTHAVHHTLIDTLLSQFTAHIDMLVETKFNAHIDMLVETKFNALVQNRNVLKLMDESLEFMMQQMIERAILDHEYTDAHFDKHAIEEIAADQARGTLSEYAERQEGWVTRDQVNDLITEHVDSELDLIDWEEKVKDVLREML